MKPRTKIGIGMMIAFLLTSVLLPMNVSATLEMKAIDTFTSISEITEEGTITFSGEDASDYRGAIDYISGNSDGDVTSSEVEEFKAYLKDETEKEEGKGYYTLDGNQAIFTYITFLITGATGGIESTEPLTIELQIIMTFSSIDKELESHTYKIVNDEEEAGTDYKLTVPSVPSILKCRIKSR